MVRLTPEVAAAAEDAAGLQAQLETAKARQQEIFSKETRTSQFGSEEERDAWIDEEVKSVRSVQVLVTWAFILCMCTCHCLRDHFCNVLGTTHRMVCSSQRACA